MHLNHAIILLDESLHITAASPSAATLLGKTRAQLVGQPCRAALDCLDQACTARCPARPALAGHEAPSEAPVHTRARQSGLRLLVAAMPLTEEGSGQRHAVLSLSTQVPPAELTALLSRRLLPLADLDGNLQAVLDDLRRYFGSDLAALAVYEKEQREIRWRMASGNLSRDTTGIRLRLGQGFAGRVVASRRPLQTAAFPTDLTRDPRSYPIFLQEDLLSALGVPLEVDGRPLGVLMVANRIAHRFTEEDRLVLAGAAEVLSLAAENLRLYQQATHTAAANERRRLAEEVHDGLSQNLFGLQLLLSDVQQSLSDGNPNEVTDRLRSASRSLDKSLVEVRRLIVRLRGEDDQQPGLVAALCDYLEYFYRLSGLEVELSLGLPPGQEIAFPDSHEILRIAQEALANAHRHGQARHLQVELAPDGDGYCLQVRDDGCGFDPTVPQPPGHFGLEIMRERARRTGSELRIESAPGQGTLVSVHFPVPRESPSVSHMS